MALGICQGTDAMTQNSVQLGLDFCLTVMLALLIIYILIIHALVGFIDKWIWIFLPFYCILLILSIKMVGITWSRL